MMSRGGGEYIVVLNALFSVRDAGCCWITNASPRSHRVAAGSAAACEIGGNDRAVAVISRMLPWQTSSKMRRKRRKRTW